MYISYFPPLGFRLSDFEDISSQLLYKPLKRQTHVAAETGFDVRIENRSIKKVSASYYYEF